MRKLLIILIKFMPIMQMVGILFNNTIYYLDVGRNISCALDFTIGNSIINTISLYICSHIFKFCIWHRLIITANFINMLIAMYDSIIGISVTDIQLLIVYYFISAISIIIPTIIHIKNNDAVKNKTTS